MAFLLIASFLFVATVTFLAGMLAMRWWPAVGPERFATTGVAAEGSILRWEDEPKTGLRSTLERVGERFEPRKEAERARYRRRLTRAGYQDPNALLFFIGTKVVLGLGLGSLYFFYGVALKRVVPNLIAVSLILAVVGFFLPDFWLHNRIKERQRKIQLALPDVLDLLMVCVEAGMGLDAAVSRVAEQGQGRSSPLHDELMRTQLEIRAGRPRAEAFRAIGDRTGVQDVTGLMGAFIQTDKLGTPLGKTLRVHADAARVQRQHRAEERAHLAPLKMIFPTIMFLFPATFLVTMAPALLNLMRLFRALGR
jgi:tight adherence protein C